MVALLGWELDLDKSEGMSRSISLLGCEVSVAPQGVHWHLGREKVVAWQREAAVIFKAGCTREWAMSAVPRSWRRILRKRATQINAFELLALVAALNTWKAQLAVKRILVFIDNTAAKDVMLSGWSRQPDFNAIAGAAWLSVAQAQASIECRWVPSASNPADCLSRGTV
ncbi:unnamed protein product, partial [Prorocentrum cordatum]